MDVPARQSAFILGSLCWRFLWNFARQLFENAAEATQDLLCGTGIQRKFQHSVRAELSAPLR
jgi:hypothetical protein